MRIEFVTNASVIFTLNNGKTILCDPWYSDGQNYGTWFNFSPLTPEEFKKYTSFKPDYIYISHTHPDHYDPPVLKHYPKDTTILIGKLPHDHLKRAMARVGFTDIRELPLDEDVEMDGFTACILNQFEGSTEGYIDETGYVIDTSIYVKDADGKACLHVVDNPMKPEDATACKEKFGKIDTAIIPFAAGSIYPLGFPQYSHEEKLERKAKLEDDVLDVFVENARILDADHYVPAAGAYVMGGRVAHLTEYLPHPVPAKIREAWQAGGLAKETLCWMVAGDILESGKGVVYENKDALFREYTEAERLDYALTLKDHPLPQDALLIPEEFTVNWPRLMNSARRNLWFKQQQMDLFPAADIEMHMPPSPGLPQKETLIFSWSLDKEGMNRPGMRIEPQEGRSLHIFTCDQSLMLMHILGAAIWNNSEATGLITCERYPDEYDPTVFSLMSFLML